MSNAFEQYSDILLDAFVSNPRSNEIAVKKYEILSELFHYYESTPKTVLCIGFSPGILKLDNYQLFGTEISPNVVDFYKQSNISVTHIDKKSLHLHKFDTVIAVDEYFTFASNDDEQRNKVDLLGNITNKFIITTLRDYKNQDFKDREFSQPISIKSNDVKKIYFENYEYDSFDKNACLGTNYCITDDSSTIVGPFARRNMYFKQLAKFSLDAGAVSFLVHKNLMHKSIIKKNYEHIITIKF